MANPLVWPRAYVVQDQMHAWECWAAVLEAVTAFYLGAKYNSAGWKPNATSITREYVAAGGPSKQVGGASDLAQALRLTGHFAGYQKAPAEKGGLHQFQASEANFNQIKTEIDAGHPVICVFRYHHHNARHVVLVYGYVDGATKQVRVADPASGQTRKDLWDFADFCGNYRAMAYWYEVGLTRENEFANLRSLFD